MVGARRGRTTSAGSASAGTAGRRTIFGQRGTFDWRDACNLCLQHHAHPAFFVRKLWSYFVAGAARRGDRVGALVEHYRADYRRAPRPRPRSSATRRSTPARGMVKPPAVYVAGLLRGLDRGVDTTDWVWLSEGAGQRLFDAAERLRLGRRAVARHCDLPRPLVDRRTRRCRGTRSSSKKGRRPPKVPSGPGQARHGRRGPARLSRAPRRRRDASLEAVRATRPRHGRGRLAEAASGRHSC